MSGHIREYIEYLDFFFTWHFRYNNKTYRIDDIEWSIKPTDTFQKRDGTQISYEDYYKQVIENLDIA